MSTDGQPTASAEWLPRRVPATPPLDDFLARLPDGIAWMQEPEEPYSTNDIRAYRIAEIDQVQILSTAFVPRCAIELTERGGLWHW